MLVGRLTLKRTHIVQSVAYLDDDHADIITHGEQQLLEVLGLCRCLFAEDSAADLCQTVNNLGYLGTEDVLDVLHGIVGILYHIV